MNNNIVHIPTKETRVSFARSSGAGGQNVNKTSTKVFIHWNIDNSNTISDKQKSILKNKLKNKINSDNELTIASETERSQIQNRKIGIDKLNTLVNKALAIPKKRKPTKPTLSSKLKRLENKKKISLLKTSRKSISD